MSPPTRSDIRTYFKPDEKDQSKAHCKICNKTYSRKGRITTSLKNHLKSMHPEEFNLFESSNEEKQFQKIKADAGSHNSERAKRMRMRDFPEKDTEQPGTSGMVRKPSLKNDLAMMLDSSSEDERIKKRANINENPLKWWRVDREELKILSPIARRFLSPLPASVPSEQLFSSVGLIYESLRNRLEPEKVANRYRTIESMAEIKKALRKKDQPEILNVRLVEAK
ncbi:hypothetical protein ILUMI_08162 [Ignelater luminosus]|uniref:BED-type domain-containing protein n=1 Tax=Ignelater luminosus TaxID=2038154 RepID=A0A8K0GG70_IGNLU|nr:hypothetical protein ILUMI_08162 [Ignelater luminosus]